MLRGIICGPPQAAKNSVKTRTPDKRMFRVTIDLLRLEGVRIKENAGVIKGKEQLQINKKSPKSSSERFFLAPVVESSI